MTTVKLASIVAVEKSKKQRTNKETGEVYKVLDKVAVFSGLHRSYHPLNDDDNEVLPDEVQKVTLRVGDLLATATKSLSELWDVTATKDYGNVQATANVVVGDTTLIEDAPVPFLLFMEKQLQDVITLIMGLPTLDPSKEWEWDDNSMTYRSNTTVTNRTKKLPTSHVKYPATVEHPAQVEVIMIDKIVGTWEATQYSGAIPLQEKSELLDRATAVLDAVKVAREEANSANVEQRQVADRVLSYIFR